MPARNSSLVPPPGPGSSSSNETARCESTNRLLTETIDLTKDDDLIATSATSDPSKSAAHSSGIGNIIVPIGTDAVSSSVSNIRVGGNNNFRSNLRTGSFDSSPGIDTGSPNLGFASPIVDQADGDEMAMYNTPEKFMLVLEEYYSHAYMNFVADDIEISSLEKMCMMDDRDNLSDEGVFGFSTPTLSAILEKSNQLETRLKLLKRIINSLVTRAEYHELCEEVSRMLDKDCATRKIAKWRPGLSISVKVQYPIERKDFEHPIYSHLLTRCVEYAYCA